MGYLASEVPDAYHALTSVLTPNNFCDYVDELTRLNQLPSLTPDDHAVQIATAYCQLRRNHLYDIPPAWYDRTVNSLKSLGMTEVSMNNVYPYGDAMDACALVQAILSVGQAPTANATLFHLLVDTCQQTIGHAGQVAFDRAIRIAGDAAAAADQGCYAETALESLKLPPDLQPIMPSVAQDADCKGSFRMLATHNTELSAGYIYLLLKSADPCTSAEAFVSLGHAPVSSLPLPDCIVGASIHLTGTPTQPTVDVGPTSSWHDKIVLLDRPISHVCDYLDPSNSTGSLVIEPPSTLPAFAALPTPTLQAFVALPTNTPPSFVALPTSTLPSFAGVSTTVSPQESAGGSPTPPPPPPQQEAQPSTDQSGSASPSESGVAPADTAAQPDWTLPLLRQVLQFDTAGASGMVLATDYAGQLRAYSLGLSDQPQPIPLPDDVLGTPSLTPDGQFVSYLTGAGDTVVLNFEPIKASAPAVSVPLSLPPTFVDTKQPLVWLPDAPKVLIDLTVGSTSGIYEVDLSSGNGSLTPQLLIQNASAPAVSPNGRLIAFERDGDIWVMATASGEMQAVTDQPDGSQCFGAQFGMDLLSLFFTCQTSDQRLIFRYGLDGVKELDFGVPNAGDPAPGPTNGLIAFNDGSAIYVARDDGSNAQPYAYLNGTTSARLVWSRDNAAKPWLTLVLDDRTL